MGGSGGGGLDSFLRMLPLESHMLHMVLQRHVEIESVVTLDKAHANKGVLCAILYLEDKVSAGVCDGFDGEIRLVVVHRALREEAPVRRILEEDSAGVACRDDAHAARENVAALGPVLAAPAAGAGPWRQRVHVRLSDHRQRPLDRRALVGGGSHVSRTKK